MGQSLFTNSDRRFEYHMVKLLYVQKFKSLLLFSTEIQPHSHLCHLCHKWHMAETLMPLNGYSLK